MARTVSYSTGPENYEEFAAKILAETGFKARVDSKFRIYFTADDASAAKLDAVFPGFTLKQDVEGSEMPETLGFFDDEAVVSADPGSAGQSTEITPEQTAAETQTETGFGGTAPGTTSILTSANLEWHFDKDTGKWYASYQLPNSDRRVFFEATGSQIDSIFGDNQRPKNFSTSSFADLSADQTFSGDILEVQGKGSFESDVARVTALALDEGVLPDWAKADGAVMDLVYIAHTEKKSQEWLIGEIAKLDSFKARFPGINVLEDQGLNIVEAVTGFLEFETGVNKVLTGHGMPAVEAKTIGDLISKGHSLTDVNKTFSAFDRLGDNQASMDAFNQILEARGMSPLSPQDQFKFMAGTLNSEIYDIYEESSFQEAQTAAGLNLSVQDSIDLAKATTGFTTFDAAFEGLSAAAANILRFRTELEYEKYDINTDDLIDLSLGIAPRSGASQADLGRNIERALLAARAGVDGPRARQFSSFTQQGVPQAASGQRSRTQR